MPGPYDNERLERRGLLGTVSLGLAVWTSEMSWLASRAMRRLEIGQLKKRLAEEYAHLGRMDAAKAKAADKAPSRKQAEFLAREIARIEEAVVRDRARFVEKRKKELGLG